MLAECHLQESTTASRAPVTPLVCGPGDGDGAEGVREDGEAGVDVMWVRYEYDGQEMQERGASGNAEVSCSGMGAYTDLFTCTDMFICTRIPRITRAYTNLASIRPTPTPTPAFEHTTPP